MSSSASTLLTLLWIALTTAALLKYLRGKDRLPLPPGPPKWPILGNIFQIPGHKQSEVYHGWAQEYSKYISPAIGAFLLYWLPQHLHRFFYLRVRCPPRLSCWPVDLDC